MKRPLKIAFATMISMIIIAYALHYLVEIYKIKL